MVSSCTLLILSTSSNSLSFRVSTAFTTHTRWLFYFLYFFGGKEVFIVGVVDLDPYGFVPPGSGSVIIRIRILILSSSSKNSKTKLAFYNIWLYYDFLSWKNDVNVPSKISKQKNLEKNYFLLASWRSLTKRAGSRSISVARIRESGSITKYHRSTTLFLYLSHCFWDEFASVVCRPIACFLYN